MSRFTDFATLTFLEFCEHLGVKLTPGQRVAAAVAFDQVEPKELEGEDREIATGLFGPVDQFPESAGSTFVLVKGARIGGSYIFGALYSLWRALTADLSGLAPGEQAAAIIVAPDQRLARQCLRYASGAAKAAPSIAPLVEHDTVDSFTIRRPDGTVCEITVLPASRGGSALRGRTLVSAVLSECAFFRDSSAAVNDVDCYRAVAPRVIPGGMVVLESTPWSEAGLLYDLFSTNYGSPKTAIAALAPTLSMRPEKREEVEREIERDPDNAAREFGAEFLIGGSGLFFPPDLLKIAMAHGLAIRTALAPGATPYIGGDLGLVRDSSAFVALHKEGETITVAEGLELRPKKGEPLKLSQVVKLGCEFAERHGSRVIHVDQHSITAAREHLPKGFVLKAISAGQDQVVNRHIRARTAFKQERVRIPQKLNRLAIQLSQIASKPLPGGKTQMVLPRRQGTHLDLAAAFVVAMGATRRVGRMLAAMENNP